MQGQMLSRWSAYEKEAANSKQEARDMWSSRKPEGLEENWFEISKSWKGEEKECIKYLVQSRMIMIVVKEV